MIKYFKFLLIALLVIKVNYFYSQDFLLTVLEEEINYQVERLKDSADKPYFIQYNASEIFSHEIQSSFGSLNSIDFVHTRAFFPELRIGDYNYDNTHQDESNPYFNALSFFNSMYQILTVEDSVFQISKAIRNSFDDTYKSALEAFSKKTKKRPDDKNDISNRNDFSKENPSKYYEPPLINLNFDKIYWEKTIKELTHIFVNEDYIETADAVVRCHYSRDYIVNNEGSSIVQNSLTTELHLSVLVKCTDGNLAPLIKSYYAFTPSGLPDLEELKKQSIELKSLAFKLKDAPSADPFSGPCILSSNASGVFFHEIFGHRIEGHRLNDKVDAQTLKNKIGDNILPEFLSISFDPTTKEYDKVDLIGYYKYDNQAVMSKKVNVVDNGKLVDFLMCRTPVESIDKSNGHGRRSFGQPAVARQSNMFISSSQSVDEGELIKRLIKICKKKKLEYGFYFKEVTGGFTSTNRFSPNAFNIIPTEVYKIYIDGRPNELIKGVTLIGTPLTMFSEIDKVGKEYSVFSGYCQAESGSLPVSVVSPTILVGNIETQRMYEMNFTKRQIIRPDLIK